MEIQFQIFKEKNLLIQKYKGNFSIPKYKAQVIKIINNPDWKNIDKVLVDLRNINLKNVLQHIEELVEIKENIINKKYVTVHLVDEPSTTVFSHLYKEELKEESYNINYCSTIEKAIELLKSNTSKRELEEMISNLNSSF
ncbi:MAG: hypothetical protein GQ540_05755 [Lutibacter sp.]|uniref:hypothetical protein n=1 Tax=Lutibacter sp. TaxID=1925666 RepID=UPI001A104A84|nr:hypothetical protein [Lutibacter sp.]NOR28015.1 hypothetical protein [Lutibacter sp.]